MPIYSYNCQTCQAQHEALTPMAERDNPIPCPTCQNPMERMIEAASVHFKGIGFYVTDVKKKKPTEKP